MSTNYSLQARCSSKLAIPHHCLYCTVLAKNVYLKQHVCLDRVPLVSGNLYSTAPVCANHDGSGSDRIPWRWIGTGSRNDVDVDADSLVCVRFKRSGSVVLWLLSPVELLLLRPVSSLVSEFQSGSCRLRTCDHNQ